jgi:hypothetical protein
VTCVYNVDVQIVARNLALLRSYPEGKCNEECSISLFEDHLSTLREQGECLVIILCMSRRQRWILIACCTCNGMEAQIDESLIED